MALKPALGLRQTQRLALTPGLRRSLDILRLPAADLAAAVAQAAAENPFLAVAPPRPARQGGGGVAGPVMPEAPPPSLPEALMRQIALMRLPPAVAALAAQLAGDLREDGYLDTPLDSYDAPDATLAAALAALQECEPAGVGARSLAECLTLQLRERGVAPRLAAAAIARIELFAAGDEDALVRALAVPAAEVRRLAGLVRRLRARPVDPDAHEPVRVLLPDLVVRRLPTGVLAVDCADDALPRVGLDRGALAQAGGMEAAARLRAEGLDLIRAIVRRRRTLRRIGAALVAAQPGYFAIAPGMGARLIVPLSRRDLAAALDLHPTTVGRAVAGKALAFEGRVLPLTMFFSPALGGAGAAAVSGVTARQALARALAAEDPAAPLSDEALAAALAAEGVDISRRTVAKYRGCMRIPSSHERLRRHRRRGMQPRSPTNGDN